MYHLNVMQDVVWDFYIKMHLSKNVFGACHRGAGEKQREDQS